jgi:hypothetical protein
MDSFVCDVRVEYDFIIFKLFEMLILDVIRPVKSPCFHY